MGIREEDLEGGLFEAFRAPAGESVLNNIERLHGAGSSILLREVAEEASPVLLRREEKGAAQDDSRYQILGEIARGGIGIVYKGRDKDLNRDVALKVLRPEHAGRADVIQRFIEEAQVGGQLQHPGIVPVYGLGLQADGRPSFAMKLIKGQTLAELLDSNPKGIDLLSVFEQVAQTMAYAHSRGVIHRDLKPANVMIGAFGEVQVVDWGFAKVLGHEELTPRPKHTIIATVRSGEEGSQSIAGSVMGTPAYMPPEQALGRIEDLDERSDVFALGAILCEILTGRPPYIGEQKDQLIAATQCLLDPAFERLEAADAAEELKEIVRACLQPLSADRPRNARILAERLSSHFANVEERVRTSELDALAFESRAAREQAGRRRAFALAAIALIAVLGGGGGYFWWKSDRDARETRAATLIASALRAATGHEGERDWSAAVSAAQKAVDTAASEGVDGSGPRAMLARLQRERAAADEAKRRRAEDEAFLVALEDVRAAGDEVNDIKTDAAYVAVVTQRWPEFDVDTVRLRASRRALAFAAVFDTWAYMRRQAKDLEGSDWHRIDKLARAIDPDHDELRDALIAEDPTELARHAESDDVLALPAALLATIGTALREAGLYAEAMAFLKRSLRKHPGDFWVHFRLASVGDKTKDFALATRHYSAALAIRPRSIEARHYLGQALAELGDLDGAIGVWLAAFALKRDWWHGHAHIASVLRKQGKHEEAETHYRKAIEGNPEDANAFSWYGIFLSERKRHDEAVKASRESVRLDPDSPNTHHSLSVSLRGAGDLDGALEEARKALDIAKTHSPAWAALGSVLSQRGEFAEALRARRRVVELDPHSADAYISLGKFYNEKLHHYTEAIVEFRNALAIDPNNARAHVNLGMALSRTGDLDDAIRQYRKAIELDPRFANAYVNLGALLCDRLRHYDDAIIEFRHALEIDPNNATAYMNVGVALRGKGDFDGAVRAFRKSIELAPAAEAHISLGALLCDNLRRYEESIVQFDHALELAPNHPMAKKNLCIAWNNVGYARLNQRELDGAISAFRKAIKFNPNNPFPQINLAVALHRQGKLDDALREYESALRLAPKAAGVYANMGSVLLEQGKTDRALVAIRKALELDPQLARDPRVARGPVDQGVAFLQKGDRRAATDAYANALKVLRAHLGALEKTLATNAPGVAQALAGWKRDPAFAPIRDADGLSDECKEFWADVDGLLARATEVSK